MFVLLVVKMMTEVAMKNEVAIFSDLHLGIYANSEIWHSIALKWADWIVSDLKKRNIIDILFLGDFFHNRTEINVQTLHVASQILEKFSDFDVLMVVGNHDAYYKHRADVHSLGLIQGHENVTIVDKLYEKEYGNKKFLFVPWNEDLPLGKWDYIMGHFEIRNFRMNNFKVCDHGLSAIDFLASRTDTVFSGHFHHRNSRSYNEGNIHYVGNPFGMDFSDVDNDKGYYILEAETGKLEFINNTVSPKFKKILLSKLKTYTKGDIIGNHVKVVVDIEVTDAQYEKVRTYITSLKPFQYFVEYNIRSKTVEEVEEIEAVDLLEQIEEFVDRMKLEKEKNERVLKILKSLYEK